MSAQLRTVCQRTLLRTCPSGLSNPILGRYSARFITGAPYTFKLLRPQHQSPKVCASLKPKFVGQFHRNQYRQLVRAFAASSEGQKKDAKKGAAKEIDPEASLLQTVTAGAAKIPGIIWSGTKSTIIYIFEAGKNPKMLVADTKEGWHHFKETMRQYWVGTKLLWKNARTARTLVGRMLVSGRGLTRRERNLLVRTTSDIFRLVPVAFFLVVPFMELALPLALKLFPNMLPSTFQDKLKQEEDMKKLLQARLGLNSFLQETMGELVKKRQQEGECEVSSDKMEAFMKKVRSGYALDSEEIVAFSRYFRDDLLLDNMARPQLVTLCRYMGLTPYGSDNFLIFQLRSKFRSIQADDQRILWEGVHSLEYEELKEACRERGMRHVGLTRFGYQRQLRQWIHLSTRREMPLSLLLMSQAFNLDAKDIDPASALRDSIGSLDDEVLQEVLLEVASDTEQTTLQNKLRKLESIQRQNELIEEEYSRRLALKKESERERQRQKKLEEAAAAAAASELEQAEAAAAAASNAELQQVLESARAADAATAPPGTAVPAAAAEDHRRPEPVLKEAEVVAAGGAAPAAADAAAAAAPPPPTPEGKKEEAPAKDLSVEELQSLAALVEKDLVTSEKAALEEIKEKMGVLTKQQKAEEEEEEETSTEAAPAAPAAAPEGATAAASQGGEGEPLAEKPKKKKKKDKLDQMTQKLVSMMDKLELDIKEAELQLSAKVDMLDSDNDGILSCAEVEDVLTNVLKTRADADALRAYIDEIDRDRDGRISIAEMKGWIARRMEVAAARREAAQEDVLEEGPAAAEIEDGAEDILSQPTEESNKSKTSKKA